MGVNLSYKAAIQYCLWTSEFEKKNRLYLQSTIEIFFWTERVKYFFDIKQIIDIVNTILKFDNLLSLSPCNMNEGMFSNIKEKKDET